MSRYIIITLSEFLARVFYISTNISINSRNLSGFSYVKNVGNSLDMLLYLLSSESQFSVDVVQSLQTAVYHKAIQNKK